MSTDPEAPTQWRERTESWPSVRVQVEFAPWHWRFYAHSDDLKRAWFVELGPLRIEVWTDLDRSLTSASGEVSTSG